MKFEAEKVTLRVESSPRMLITCFGRLTDISQFLRSCLGRPFIPRMGCEAKRTAFQTALF